VRNQVFAAVAVIAFAITSPALAQEQKTSEAKIPPEQQKVSRLPPLPQPLDPILQKLADESHARGGVLINLQIATGHAPKFTQAARSMAFTIRFDTKLPRRLVELVIMRTAQIVGATYELNQHTPFIKACGYSDAQIAAIPAWQTSTLFDDQQRAVLDYVEQMAHGGDVDDAAFAAVQKFFTSEEIVEMSYIVASYYSTGLLTKALRIEIEKDGRSTVPGKCS
jgi:alkylhydroperoxidase family enzyme